MDTEKEMSIPVIIATDEEEVKHAAESGRTVISTGDAEIHGRTCRT